MESSVDQIAGNQVDLGLDVTCSVVVAKDHLIADSRFNCEDEEGGLTAKQITLGWGVNVEGKIVLPDGGSLSLGKNCSIDAIESNHNFQLQTGRSFSNNDRTRLQEDYNLAVEISDLIDRALDLDS